MRRRRPMPCAILPGPGDPASLHRFRRPGSSGPAASKTPDPLEFAQPVTTPAFLAPPGRRRQGLRADPGPVAGDRSKQRRIRQARQRVERRQSQRAQRPPHIEARQSYRRFNTFHQRVTAGSTPATH